MYHTGGNVRQEQPHKDRRPRDIGALYRELIRSWRRQLRARGFSDEEAARLIYVKVLYIRGSFR